MASDWLPAWQLLAGMMESGGDRTRAACLGSIASSVICFPFFFFLTSPVVSTAAAASCDRSSAWPPTTTCQTELWNQEGQCQSLSRENGQSR